MLPETLDELDAVRERCREIVTKSASLSATVAIVPLPGLDVGTDIAILTRLLPRISREFGLSAEQLQELDTETRKIVLVLASALGSELVGRTITREVVTQLLKKVGIRLTTGTLSKLVPLVGQALAASVSFAAMRFLGNGHVEDCYRVARRALEARAQIRGGQPADVGRLSAQT